MNASQNIWSLSLFSQLNKLIEQWKYTFLVLVFNAFVCRFVCLVVPNCVSEYLFAYSYVCVCVVDAVFVGTFSDVAFELIVCVYWILWMKALTNQIRLIVNIQLFFCGGNIEKTTAFNLYYTCFVRFNLLFATVFPLVLIIKCKNLSTSFTLVQWSKSHFLLITQTFCKLLIDFKWIFKVFQIDINKSVFIKKFGISILYSKFHLFVSFENDRSHDGN